MPKAKSSSNLWPKKGQKEPNFIWPFFIKKRPKELKKGQKLQIWSQKSQTGNPECLKAPR